MARVSEGSSSRLRLAVAAVAVFVVVFGGVRLLDRPRAGPSSSPAPPVTLDSPSSASSPSSGQLFVDVAGEIRRPGLYRIERGARVAAAIRRAGGFTDAADSAQVNLAAPLQDGQQ